MDRFSDLQGTSKDSVSPHNTIFEHLIVMGGSPPLHEDP